MASFRNPRAPTKNGGLEPKSACSSIDTVGMPPCAAVGLMPHIQLDIITVVRPVCFLGDSLKCIRDFPDGARNDMGYQLDKGQRGDQPDDFKPMSGIGKGVEEIRIAEPSGAYLVIYVARRVDVVYVLHAFQKKTQATPKKDLEIARQRFGKLKGEKL